MKNEKSQNFYFALHRARTRLSLALRSVEKLEEWFDEREINDCIEEMDGIEWLYKINLAIDRTLDAHSELNNAVIQLIDLMGEQRAEEKYHDLFRMATE